MYVYIRSQFSITILYFIDHNDKMVPFRKLVIKIYLEVTTWEIAG